MDVGEQRSWTNEELAALYDRFFAPLYDVSIRVLGSEDTAALAVGRAFSRAFAELRRRPVDELRPWLYGLLAPELQAVLAHGRQDSRRLRVEAPGVDDAKAGRAPVDEAVAAVAAELQAERAAFQRMTGR
mgnify:CR=1 FL=1